MSEKYPYPEAEHYVFPKNHIELMNEQTRRFQGRALREEVTLNLKYYENTPFCKALKNYSQLGRLALVNSGGGESRESALYGLNYFAGGVAALHANLHPAPHPMKEWILSQNPLRFIDDPDIPENARHEAFEAIVGIMDAWRIGEATLALENQPEEFRAALECLADAMYADTSEPGENAKMFIDGFMLTSDMIWTHGLYYRSRIAPTG